jgi:hypothetical protein
MTWVAGSAAQAADAIDPLAHPPARGFISHTQASSWEEALISGNGSLGALVMGNPRSETIILSHERLFMPMDKAMPPVPLAPRLDEIRALVDAGRYSDAAQLAEEISFENDYKEMPWTDPLIPAFDIIVEMDGAGDPQNYARSVDFETGVATVRWEEDNGIFIRRLFVSRADDVAVLSITGPKPGSVDCTIKLATRPAGSSEEDDEGEGGFAAGIRDVEIAAEGPMLVYRSMFAKPYPGSLEGYEGATFVSANNGSTEASDGAVRIAGADAVMVLARVSVLNDYDDSLLGQTYEDLSEMGSFDDLLARHTAIHGEMFNRTRLDLGDEDMAQPSEELLAGSSMGNLDPRLLDRLYDASRYAILSSTGDYPPTLQGIWTGTWTPPWMSDWTINGNVQTAIAGMLSGNMTESMEAYFSLMEEHVPDYRENAERMYGARGILTPARLSTHGYFNHFNAQYIHLFWTSGAGWASQFFYDYYLYTGDKEFLRERALPWMRETALFYEDFLIEGPDGKYVFNPSYSPENTAANSDSQASINATMEVAICRELLTNLVSASKELGVEEDGVARWEAMIEKLPDYMINNDGAVKEWTTDKLKENYLHRHGSQMYALFAGLPDEIAGDENLQRAFVEAIERRLAFYRAEGGDMSFGLVQLGLSAASLGNADQAYEAIDRLANDYWRANLVSTHNVHSLFNVDICGGMPALINHMLVQSSPGSLLLLPALPDEWPTGRIKGILARGQITIESLEWDEEEARVVIRSGKRQQIRIAVRGGGADAEVTSGEAELQSLDDGVYTISLPANETIALCLPRGN